MSLQTRNAYQVKFTYCLDCLKLWKRIFRFFFIQRNNFHKYGSLLKMVSFI